MWTVLLASLQEAFFSHPLLQDWLSKYDLSAETFWDRGNVYQILLDVMLVSFVVYVIFRKPVKEEKPLTENEMQQLIDEWQPEKLFVPISERERKLGQKIPVITKTEGPFVTINGKEILNLVRSDFCGFLSNNRVKDAVRKSIYTYGTGTCGPRNFYGTIDVHLTCEKRISDFLGTEATILFSYGFATISSVIPTFSGRSDLIVADEAICYPIQTGIKLSRSDVIYFKHNDMEDLERVLNRITSDKKRKLTRRFLVIEGVYQNVGDIVNLPKVVELKEKYKFRLIMDDSFGIGIIGKTGRGTCEYFNISPKKIDFLTANLATTTGSVGGFCTGERGIVAHQVLHASGYVYSASLPPLLTQAAIEAFDIINESPELLKQLEDKSKLFYDRLSKLEGISLSAVKGSPVLHLRLARPSEDRLENEEKLQEIVDEALQQGLFLTRAKYCNDERKMPPPSIRIYVSNAFSDEQVERAISIIESSVKKVLASIPRPRANE